MKRFFLIILINLFLSLFLASDIQAASLSINSVSDNLGTFSNNQVPLFEKLEITFQVSGSVATNFQMPYDTNPPAGITPGQGITVDATFVSPSGKNSIQPAFYYQDFDYQQKNGSDWFYPTQNFSWKVRFSPNEIGNWKYSLTAKDGTGTISTNQQSFTVSSSSNKGFIKVSKNDSRYFEYSDGTYFPGLGYNMNYDHINWDNPILSNQTNFQKMGQSGIQLIRHWLSQWGIWSSTDVTWASMTQGPDYSGLTTKASFPGSDVSMMLRGYYEPCLALGAWKEGPAVKPNTNYKVFIRYLIPTPITSSIAVDSTKPAGLVAKVDGWLDPPSNPRSGPKCDGVGAGTDIMPVVSSSPVDANNQPQWSIVSTSFNSSISGINNGNFISRFYLSLENVNNTSAISTSAISYIDRVEIREDTPSCAAASGVGNQFDLTNGQCGVDIVSRPSAAFHQYMDQKYSAAFDKVLDLAKQNGVYLKLVVMEKNEFIQDRIDYNGNITLSSSNNNFYGDWRNITKVRWLQQAWWRYLQGRWGYSTNIHSWELLNEGDPFNGLHYTLADEFAKYMHNFGSNSHLVTTSFWHSFPTSAFWRNSNYPNLDYADVHQYIFKDQSVDLRIDDGAVGSVHLYDANNSQYYDSAVSTKVISDAIGAKQLHGVGKPIMRGETGFVTSGNTGVPDPDILKDTTGLWLHNFIWGSINSSGLIESYWYDDTNIANKNFDHRNEFGNYYRFIKDIPLSNGHYVDAAATASDPTLRIWGQKDLTNYKAHLWINNANHTWKNIIDNLSVSPISSSVTIPGFPPNQTYSLEWWNTYTGQIDNSLGQKTTNSDSGGAITFSIFNLTTDLAVKISSGNSFLPNDGDLNNDGRVDIIDMKIALSNFGQSSNIFELSKVIANFGK